MKRFFVYVVLGTFCALAQPAWPDEVRHFAVTIKDHQFHPSELEVPVGERIVLTIENMDATPEEFESHDLKREKIIQGGSKASIQIGPLAAGAYRFFGEFHQDTARGLIIAKGDSPVEASAEDEFWDEHEEEEEYHGHVGEHGGQFGDASDVFHYEVLLDEGGDVRVYVYDGKALPIADTTVLKTRWTLNPDAEYPLQGELALSQDKQSFFIDLPPATSDFVSVKIEAEEDGEWWPVEFLLSKNDKN